MEFIIAFILQFLAVSSTTTGQGIQFEPENEVWANYLNKAQTEEKILFVVAYSTSCHNCEHMKENIFPKETVGAVFNEQYINVKIDVEQGEGLEIAGKYQINAYPTYLFLDANGQQLHRAMGSMEVEEFIELGKQAVDPEYQFFTLKERFIRGERSEQLLQKLTLMAIDLSDYELLQTVPAAYLATQSDWLEKDKMEIILSTLKSIEQSTFSFLLQHRAAFIEQYDTAKINNLIDEVILNSMSMAAWDHSLNDFDLQKARTYGTQYLTADLLEQAMSVFNVNQLMRKQQTSAFLLAAVDHFDRYTTYNGFLLNNIALTFYENTDEPELLEKALSWAIRATELKEVYSFYDTAAALYFKLGQKEKARTYAQQAIEVASKTGAHAEETEALLARIELDN